MNLPGPMPGRTGAAPSLVAVDDLPQYPVRSADRLDSHWFMAWERRRWLNSEMRLMGTPEARALYFDLINICYDQTPMGTLPDDSDQLARLALVDRDRFEALCRLPYGPLHRWQRCVCDDDDDAARSIRLFHPQVLRTLTEAIARREDNRARNEAANAKKRLQRLRALVAGLHADLARNDAAVSWMDDWLVRHDCGYRNTDWAERAIAAWSNHMFDLNRRR